MYKGIVELVEEISRCEKCKLTMASVCLTYVAIDTLSFLSMPSGKTSQTRTEFVAWVDAYLKADPAQPYQYRGIDVYAGRCSVLHAFGSEAELHRKDEKIILFGYHDGGKHMYDPAVDKRLALIGVASLVPDIAHATQQFFRACQADEDLKSRVEARLPKVLATLPLPRC